MGAISKGYVNLAPMDDADVDIEIDCMEITDSYDPNYKANSPFGVGPMHIVLPKTLLDYTLHFQNTGSDTAYKVVLIDTLSEKFDLASLELGASSHHYTMEISGENKPVIKFVFNNINLVDSATNEPESHGFVKFKIAPESTVALGTTINNFVDIYFDYNEPVRTNVAFVTIDNYPLQNTTNSNSDDENVVLIYPNPVSKAISISPCKPGQKLEIYNMLGEKMMETVISSENQINNVSHFSAGVYLLTVTDADGRRRAGRFVKD